MSKHRIIPYGSTKWAVQSKWLGLFWRIHGRFVAYDWWSPYIFDTEAEAEAYIREQIATDLADENDRQQARQRRKHYAPRPFP